MSDPNLVTTCNLHGQDYLIKMNVVEKNYLELTVTDKQTGEEWQCSYDHSFVENLTHKTGNFKQFDIFVTMLKSGLLKTSSCIGLDLLTYDDLEALRLRKLKTNPGKMLNCNRANNRRYLILTYTVEFDRIHYPLPLEYCGPPDPLILQATIKKLVNDLQEAKEAAAIGGNCTCGSKNDLKEICVLQKRLDDLEYENDELRCENYQLKSRHVNNNKKRFTTNNNNNQLIEMQRAIGKLERSVIGERKTHNRLVEQLRNEKINLHKEVERLRNNVRVLKVREQELNDKHRNSAETFKTMYRRRRSNQMKIVDGTSHMRQRSISPRETRSEGWASDDRSYYEKSSRCARRTKSPLTSSLMSSARGERIVATNATNVAYVANRAAITCDSPSSRTKLHSPKQSSPTTARRFNNDKKKYRNTPRSRSTSTASNSSTNKSKKSERLRDVVRSSEADFKTLEERMQWLQKLLKAE